jgi:hypothetical protein
VNKSPDGIEVNLQTGRINKTQRQMIARQFDQDFVDYGIAIPFNKRDLGEFGMVGETGTQYYQDVRHIDKDVSREIAFKSEYRRTINFLRCVSDQASAGT